MRAANGAAKASTRRGAVRIAAAVHRDRRAMKVAPIGAAPPLSLEAWALLCSISIATYPFAGWFMWQLGVGDLKKGLQATGKSDCEWRWQAEALQRLAPLLAALRCVLLPRVWRVAGGRAWRSRDAAVWTRGAGVEASSSWPVRRRDDPRGRGRGRGGTVSSTKTSQVRRGSRRLNHLDPVARAAARPGRGLLLSGDALALAE